MTVSGINTSRSNLQQVHNTQQVAETPKPAAQAPVAAEQQPTVTPERVAASEEVQADTRNRVAAGEGARRTQVGEQPSRVAPGLDEVRAGTGNLRIGHEGQSVRDLQKMLNESGTHPRLQEDGKFGLKTRNAVEEFQRSRNITERVSRKENPAF